jgi:hypothetical protein
MKELSIGFPTLGIWASNIYLNFFSHVLHHGSFDDTANNSLAQLLPSFAFVMIDSQSKVFGA